MTKNREQPADDQRLSAEEWIELQEWKARWYGMAIHTSVEYQMKRALDGEENTVILGPKGVGKTETIRSAIRALQVAETQRTAGNEEPDTAVIESTLDSPRGRKASSKLPPYPRGILYYETGEATGTKTIFTDILRKLKVKVKPAQLRQWSPTEFVERTLEELKRRLTHLIVIDEAQFISPNNLEHFRQIYDYAGEEDFKLGMVLSGDYPLRANLAEIGQLGQRFTSELRFPPFGSLAGEIHEWHPHLARLKKEMKPSEWKRLSQEVVSAANGSFRRLVQLLKNANALALHLEKRVDQRVLELAIDNLAGEV